jgi:hypothetical protein
VATVRLAPLASPLAGTGDAVLLSGA